MKSNSNNIRVINKEYERVLANPDNVIISDALKDIISSNFSYSQVPNADGTNDDNKELNLAPSKDLRITITIPGEEPVSLLGDLSEISFSSERDNEYKIAVDVNSLKQEFLSCLNSTVENFIEIEGLYNLIAFAQFSSWSITKPSSHVLRLQIAFRSRHVTI